MTTIHSAKMIAGRWEWRRASARTNFSRCHLKEGGTHEPNGNLDPDFSNGGWRGGGSRPDRRGEVQGGEAQRIAEAELLHRGRATEGSDRQDTGRGEMRGEVRHGAHEGGRGGREEGRGVPLACEWRW